VSGSLLMVLGASQLIGLAGVGLAALATWRLSDALLRRCVAFAAGAMLATALLDILPEALAHAPAEAVLQTVLFTILALFCLEKAALWRHAHATPQDTTPQASRHLVWIVVAGDGLHNFVDGVLIAAAFAVDNSLGWVTTLAIVAHEIPQEIGDFLVLRHAGLSARRAFLLNLLSSGMAVVGGLTGYFLLSSLTDWLPYVLAGSAAGFLYIAIADLMPSLNRSWSASETRWQTVLLTVGVVCIPVLHHLMH